MADLWDWADIAAVGVMARRAEVGPALVLKWHDNPIAADWLAILAVTAAGIRYGANLTPRGEAW